MPTLQAFTNVISEIQQWFKSESSYSEAVVSQCVVLRILQAAGFDIWNPQEVTPQVTSETGKRADFLVNTSGERFAFELKGKNIRLSPNDYEQAGMYAATANTRWAILTNGLKWSVIDTKSSYAPFHEREVLCIEWGNDIDIMASELYNLLNYQNWETAKVDESIKSIKTERLVREIIQYYLPRIKAFAKSRTIDNVINAVDFFFWNEQKDGAQPKTTWETDEDIIREYLKAEQAKKSKEGKLQQTQAPTALTTPLAPKQTPQITEEFILFHRLYKGKNARAAYYPTMKKWVLLKDSELDLPKPLYPDICKRREQLEEEGFITQNADGYVVIRDIEFNSPSPAAECVTGKSTNGWDFWKNPEDENKTAQHYRTKSVYRRTRKR